MKKTVTTFAALAIVAVLACPAFAANAVRISQVFGGGGNSGGTYLNDYVELYNSSAVSIDISGWSLQYNSATGTTDLGTCTNCLTVLPAGSCIGPNGYFLIQLAAGTNTADPPLPVTPDYAAPQATANNMSASSGKIALKNNNVTTPCSPTTAFVDLVGYGTANCAEGLAAGGLSNSTGLVRNLNGAQDSDNNNLDFTVVSNPVPRNSHNPGSVPPDCSPVPTKTQTWGQTKASYR